MRSYCGADYSAVYRFAHDAVDQLAGGRWSDLDMPNKQLSTYLQGGYWRKDPALLDAQKRLDKPGHCAVMHQDRHAG